MKKILAVLAIICSVTLVSHAWMGSSFEQPVKACVSHILVPTEKDALELKSQISSYADFQKYARMYSQCPSSRNGGDLGCFGKGQMVKPFEEAAFKGQVGVVSEPVKTQFGYHLLWIIKRY